MDVCSPSFRKFLRLRSYVHQMKAGGYLLVRESRGAQVRWFALDNTLSYLTWVDPQDRRRSASVSLADIVEIIYEQNGSRVISLADSPSFVLVTKSKQEVDIVASNWREFEVWYQGLVFLTGIGANYSHRLLDMLRSNQSSQADQLSQGQAAPRPSYSSRASQVSQSSQPISLQVRRGSALATKESAIPATSSSYTSDSQSESMTEDDQSESQSMTSVDLLQNRVWALERLVKEQQSMIEKLQSQNEVLQDIRLQKDQTIQRLLRDLQDSNPATQRSLAPGHYSSRESDLNHRSRTPAWN